MYFKYYILYFSYTKKYSFMSLKPRSQKQAPHPIRGEAPFFAYSCFTAAHLRLYFSPFTIFWISVFMVLISELTVALYASLTDAQVCWLPSASGCDERM